MVLLQRDEIKFLHKDTGPLMFANVEKLSKAIEACRGASVPSAAQ